MDTVIEGIQWLLRTLAHFGVTEHDLSRATATGLSVRFWRYLDPLFEETRGYTTYLLGALFLRHLLLIFRTRGRYCQHTTCILSAWQQREAPLLREYVWSVDDI